jgi:hypothetical protein
LRARLSRVVTGGNLVKLAFVSIMSCIAGTAVGILLLIATSQLSGRSSVTQEDLTGLALFSFLPELFLCGFVYLPGLSWLRKRRSGCIPPWQFVLTSALLLNTPSLGVLLLGMLTDRWFSGVTEVSLFAAAFVVTGAVFGAGFVWSSSDWRAEAVKLVVGNTGLPGTDEPAAHNSA